MAFHIHNTFSGQKERFQSLEEGHVRIYSCGPTVYDYVHLGNLRTFLFADILVRYLKFLGYRVTQIMNLTDVDDKTIRASQRQKLTLSEYTKVYKKSFFRDLQTLKITPATAYPAATEHIPEMIQLIEALKAKGHAYASEGSTYFKIETYDSYGNLSKIQKESLKSGASGRIINDEYTKEHIGDFVLWKAHTPDDGTVFWESSLGRGRPGWHIECSAMSMKYLGTQFDIHTGGVDNIFPHHENEQAQSASLTGHPLANYWIHSEFLSIKSQKLSKSTGTVIHLQELIEKGHTKEAIRLSLIHAHYRSKLQYSEKLIKESQKNLNSIQDFIAELHRIQKDSPPLSETIIEHSLKSFQAALDDDLNMPEAFATIFTSIKSFRRILHQCGRADKELILKYFRRVNEVLAVLDLEERSVTEDIADSLEKTLESIHTEDPSNQIYHLHKNPTQTPTTQYSTQKQEQFETHIARSIQKHLHNTSTILSLHFLEGAAISEQFLQKHYKTLTEAIHSILTEHDDFLSHTIPPTNIHKASGSELSKKTQEQQILTKSLILKIHENTQSIWQALLKEASPQAKTPTNRLHSLISILHSLAKVLHHMSLSDYSSLHKTLHKHKETCQNLQFPQSSILKEAIFSQWLHARCHIEYSFCSGAFPYFCDSLERVFMRVLLLHDVDFLRDLGLVPAEILENSRENAGESAVGGFWGLVGCFLGRLSYRFCCWLLGGLLRFCFWRGIRQDFRVWWRVLGMIFGGIWKPVYIFRGVKETVLRAIQQSKSLTFQELSALSAQWRFLNQAHSAPTSPPTANPLDSQSSSGIPQILSSAIRSHAHEMLTLLQKRSHAKLHKNYAEADSIREYFKKQGIILEDSAQGVRIIYAERNYFLSDSVLCCRGSVIIDQ